MPGSAGEQVHGLEIAAVHGVDLARLQCVRARRDIDNGDELDLVEVSAMRRLPVVLEACEAATDPGLEIGQTVAAATGAGLPVDAFSAGGQDRDVVVADDVGEVGVPAGEGDHHRILAFHLDLRDRLQQGLGRRLRVLVPVVVDRSHHIVGVEGLAVVELHPLADLEAPSPGIGGCLPALRQLRFEPVDGDLGEVVVLSIVEHRHVVVLERRGVQRVGGRAVGNADPKLPAPLRGRRLCRLREKSGGEHPGGSKRSRSGHKLPPGDRARLRLGREGREFMIRMIIHGGYSSLSGCYSCLRSQYRPRRDSIPGGRHHDAAFDRTLHDSALPSPD